jgi:aminopeptidase
MKDPRVDRLAHLLVHYSLRIKPGDLAVAVGMPLAEPLLLAFYREALKAGAYVDLQVRLADQEEVFLKTANDDQLRFVSPLMELPYSHYNARLSVPAHPNTRSLSNVDPARHARWAETRGPLIRKMLERQAAGEYRWCGFYYPTAGMAQDAEMSLEEFTDFVFGACFLDDPKPVVRWETLGREQARLIEWLRGKREIRIVAPDTDLTFSVEGRKWINCCGHVNMPDGEFFTGPVEDSARGHIRFTYPAVEQNRLVEDVRLTFEDGRVVEAKASRNEEFLHQMLSVDEGAKRLGEFAFGNNPAVTRFTKEVAFDEKIAGTVHLAIGLTPPETGGSNRSAIHWDMVCDLRQGGEVYADGELFVKDGRFVVKS